jgi:hypothetical protein
VALSMRVDAPNALRARAAHSRNKQKQATLKTVKIASIPLRTAIDISMNAENTMKKHCE